MRIFFIAHAKLPTKKAHGLGITKLCEALAAHTDLVLVHSKRRNKNKADMFEYYDLKRRFKHVSLPVIDAVRFPFLGVLGYWIGQLSFSVSVLFFVIFRTEKNDIFFSREHAILLIVSPFRKNLFYDLHDFPHRGSLYFRFFFNRVRGIISTNTWKKDELLRRFRVPAERVLVAPNGVDLSDYQGSVDARGARQMLGIETQKKIVLYTGQLLHWKGVDTLLSAAKFLPSNVSVYIVGGSKHEVDALRGRYRAENVVFVGQRPHKEMSHWQRAADVLVLPNTKKEHIATHYTSPIKLFEYMASGTPIVASDLPSIREIADDTAVVFFEADDSRSLAQSIQSVFENPEEAHERAARAKAAVAQYTWDARAERIISFVTSKIRDNH